MSSSKILLLVGSLALSGCLGWNAVETAVETTETSIAEGPRQSGAPSSDHRESHLGTDAGVGDKDREAIARALPFLQQEGADWMAGQVAIQGGDGCVSCHHVPYGIWSHKEAERVGFALSDDMRSLIDEAIGFAGRKDKARPMSVTPLLLAGALPGEGLGRRLLEHQESDGRFRARGQFPAQRRTTTESDAVATLWSIPALDVVGRHLDPSSTKVPGALDDARAWLASADPGETVEWTAAGLAAAVWAGSGVDLSLKRRLLEAQNDDGGWPWAPGEPSNAFSTGQALYALALAGDGQTDVGDRARAYLIETQTPEGTWIVPSSAISREGNHERDIIYRYWGTAWAVIGLARATATADARMP